MKVHNGIENLEIRNPVVTIGSFDGVHLGHIKVIGHLIKRADELSGESVIITFEPHPREVLYPNESSLGILTTMNEKISILEKAGIDNLIILPFNKELANLSYDEFIKDILVDKLNMKGLVIGYDHRFGKNRTGNYSNLLDLSQKYYFSLEQEEVFEDDNINVSSTKIRNALAVGDIHTVNKYLGYEYSLSGTVVEGQKIGRQIDYPTANIKLSNDKKLIPAVGVYAVKIEIKDNEYYGMLNIGQRPTISDNGAISIEVHIFDFDKEIYGETMQISFLHRLRGEQKFNDILELREQLEKDKNNIKRLLI